MAWNEALALASAHSVPNAPPALGGLWSQDSQGGHAQYNTALALTPPSPITCPFLYYACSVACMMTLTFLREHVSPNNILQLSLSKQTDAGHHKSLTEYPCYGFFGMSAEIRNHRHLDSYAVKQCTSQLYKIGKGQMPSGILAICRSPKSTRNQAGGNDQVQRLCKLHGISRGKDGASAMNSSAATVAYVAATHTLFEQLITRATTDTRPAEAATTGDAPDRIAPDPSTPIPDSTSHETPPADSGPPHHPEPSHRDSHPDDHRHHHTWNDSTWHGQSWRDTSAYNHRRYSAFGEGRPRDRHSEGSSGTRRNYDTSSRTRW